MFAEFPDVLLISLPRFVTHIGEQVVQDQNAFKPDLEEGAEISPPHRADAEV